MSRGLLNQDIKSRKQKRKRKEREKRKQSRKEQTGIKIRVNSQVHKETQNKIKY